MHATACRSFSTTNQDYGSFYSGRCQYGHTDPKEIAFELAINDQVRHERCQLPSIAYDIMFNRDESLQITSHDKRKFKPIISRRQLKYVKYKRKNDEKRRTTVSEGLQTYAAFIQCIYQRRPEEKPKVSDAVLELVANELVALRPELSADELAEYMVAITVPSRYMDVSTINPDRPYPGTEQDCRSTVHHQRLLDRFAAVQTSIDASQQPFDSNSLRSQPLHGVRYIYNPFKNATPARGR